MIILKSNLWKILSFYKKNCRCAFTFFLCACEAVEHQRAFTCTSHLASTQGPAGLVTAISTRAALDGLQVAPGGLSLFSVHSCAHGTHNWTLIGSSSDISCFSGEITSLLPLDSPVDSHLVT